MNGRTRSGFASIPMVSAFALIFMMTLLMLLRTGLMEREEMAKNQLRADYQQREEAFLRALVAVFPQKAIACMKADYAPNDAYAWRAIFDESQTTAGVSSALSTETQRALGLERTRNANTANASASEVAAWVSSLTGDPASVTPGTTEYSAVFADPRFAGKMPPLLTMSTVLQQADAARPIISTLKTYSTQTSGLLVEVLHYPLYNYIPYPDIRFAYAIPGQPIVAKRNWWAFAVKFGASHFTGSNPAQPITKYYVLSLYEIPTQLPIEAAQLAQIGAHQDGTPWDASQISITGGVYGDRLAVSDTLGISRLTGRKSVQLGKKMSLDGVEFGGDFDQPGVREALQAHSNSDVLPLGISSNSGRLTFFPINRGSAFLQRSSDSPSSNTWELYSVGAENCPVTVKAVSMVSAADQTPTKIKVRFATPGGGVKEVSLSRDSNWPNALQPGGSALPFQTELTSTSHSCLTFYPSLLNDWLVAQGGAGVSLNNCIHLRTNPTEDPFTVLPASVPPRPEDMALVIRKGKDLTAYTNGLSIVSPLRVYIGDDLNNTPNAAPPAGSGLDPGSAFFPPISIFAAELRVGTTATPRPLQLNGQIGSLVTDPASQWNPLDLKSGSDDATHLNSVQAELKPLKSPAELPPIHGMNWLTIIEEIH